jgi:glycine C-acetyltransferase
LIEKQGSGGILVITEGVFGMAGDQGKLKRLDLLRTRPEFKDKLWENALKLQNGLKERGFDIGNTDTPVTPVYMKGGVEEATAMVMDLRENYGIFASVVVYPVIPKGHIIYRLIPTAVHTDKDIEETLNAFSETKKKLDNGEYKVEAIPDMAEYSAKRFEYFGSKPKSSK